MKHITLGDFLTDAEIAECQRLWRDREKSETRYNTLVKERIIQPNMARINKALGQENDASYLAYAIEYVMMQAEGK